MVGSKEEVMVPCPINWVLVLIAFSNSKLLLQMVFSDTLTHARTQISSMLYEVEDLVQSFLTFYL